MTLPRPGPSFPAVPGVCFSPGRMLFCRLPRTADYTAPKETGERSRRRAGMLHPPCARTAALPPAVREAGADTGSRHSLQTVYRKTVQRCYTLVVGKYLQTDRPAGRSARARAEGEPFMELRSNIKMLNYARKYLLNDTDNILPFPVRPQKPPRTGRLPTLLPRSAPRDGTRPIQAGIGM